jgi:hypothetical protein
MRGVGQDRDGINLEVRKKTSKTGCRLGTDLSSMDHDPLSVFHDHHPLTYRVAASLGVICAIAMTGCGHVRKIPAKGNLQGYAIETTVDDESAKYYLENYLAGDVKDAHLHQKIAEIHRQVKDELPSREQLKKNSTDFSVDFAALFFGNQLLKQKGNSELQKQFLKNLDKVRNGTAEYPKKDVLIMLVPGYDYVKNGHVTGADFANPRKLLGQAGYEVCFVGIDPLGSVEENAAYLAKSIVSNRDRKIAIAGASSAGPAIHLALGKLVKPDDLVNVKAWLNLGGILQGVPVLDKFSSGPKGWLFSTVLWFKGWKKSSFESMHTAVSRKRFATLSVPGHIAIYNYIGLSLSGNVSRFARDKYLMMREDGPNDGLTLLADIVAPGSFSILSPKTDHFFAEDPEIDKKTLALLVTILGRIPD